MRVVIRYTTDQQRNENEAHRMYSFGRDNEYATAVYASTELAAMCNLRQLKPHAKIIAVNGKRTDAE